MFMKRQINLEIMDQIKYWEFLSPSIHSSSNFLSQTRNLVLSILRFMRRKSSETLKLISRFMSIEYIYIFLSRIEKFLTIRKEFLIKLFTCIISHSSAVKYVIIIFQFKKELWI